MLLIILVLFQISFVAAISLTPLLPQLWRDLITYLDLSSEFCPSTVGFSRKKLLALFNDIDCMMHHIL